MVATRGKKKTASSNKTIEEKEAAEKDLSETLNSDSLTVDVVEPNEDAQLEGKADLITDKARDENSGEEGEEEIEQDSEVPTMPEAETNGDHEAESEENTYEDDEIDDQEDMLWEDDEELIEHENEERVLDEFEVSEEEATDEDDEVSGEEAIEEDEVSEEEATKEENYEDNDQEEKGIAKQDTREAKAKEDRREAKEHGTEKPEANLKNINKSNVRRNKKVQAGRLKIVDSEGKPESSRKRKVKKRVDSMGMVFMCSSETKKDCYQYRVLGLPESKKDIVEKIYTGMRLFLYDIDLKLMYGIYKAAAPGGYNIEPKAFKSQFPSQVRFKVLESCVPLAEEKFKTVIKENYFTRTKFDCQLNSEQVKKLCRLFALSSKGRPSKKLSISLKDDKHKQPIRPERNRRQRTGDKRRLPLREEVKHHERPRKRLRKVMSPPPPRQRPAAQLPSTVPSSYAYSRASDADVYRRDLYLEPRSPYRDRRDRPLTPIERYKDGRDPRLERRYAYRGGRDSHVGRRDPFADDVDSYSRRRDLYRDERVPYLEPRDSYTERLDSYRDGRDRDPYIERRDSYRDGRDSYIERRDSDRDGRDPYVERRDSYREGRASYLDRRVSFGDSAHSELYNTYRRDSLLDSRDVYRGVELRDSYRRDELLGHRDLHPIDMATRNHPDIDGRDAYVSNRERPSYAEPVYSAAYPSRAAAWRR